MKNKKILLLSILTMATTILAAGKSSQKQEYVIEQPGTITFTSGVKIAGKVEKPQVMIFMSKESSLSFKPSFEHSFESEIFKPIEQPPVINIEQN